MRSTSKTYFLLLPIFLSVAHSQTLINVVPEPNSIVPGHGTFLLSSSTTIACDANIERLGNYLAQRIDFFTRLKLSIATSLPPRKNVVSLVLDSTLEVSDPEGYVLDVMPSNLLLKAKTEVGLFRGTQTLLQLIPLPDSTNAGRFDIPCCRIMDYPRFSWRGLNFDCVRHFMTKDFIKRYIDLLAYYKFNVFHWDTHPVAPYKEATVRLTQLVDGTTYAIYLADKGEKKPPQKIWMTRICPAKGARLTMLGSNEELIWQKVA